MNERKFVLKLHYFKTIFSAPSPHKCGSRRRWVNYDLPIFYNKSTKLNEFTSSKSTFFYKNLIKFKVEKPTKQENHWINICNVKDFNFDYVYISQICKVKDRKIAEFNFKVLHNVLSCNANLVKWKKKDIALCNICGELETIEHLLFNCTFAKRIWIDFNTMVDFIVLFCVCVWFFLLTLVVMSSQCDPGR